VWVVREGRLTGVEVNVVRVAEGEAIVEPGELKAGERVVVTPLAGAVDEMAVREERQKADR
jgi:hypothetical protein